MYVLFPPTDKIECDAPPLYSRRTTHTKCGVWFLLVCLFFSRTCVQRYMYAQHKSSISRGLERSPFSDCFFVLFCFFKEPKRVLLNTLFDTSIFRFSFYHRRHSTSQKAYSDYDPLLRCFESMGSFEPRQREHCRHALPPTGAVFASALLFPNVFFCLQPHYSIYFLCGYPHPPLTRAQGPSLDILRYALLVCQSFEKRVGRDTV